MASATAETLYCLPLEKGLEPWVGGVLIFAVTSYYLLLFDVVVVVPTEMTHCLTTLKVLSRQ